MWDEITYPFLNFNGATVEVLEWISNFIVHFTEHVITYPCWEWSSSMLVKWATGIEDGGIWYNCINKHDRVIAGGDLSVTSYVSCW